MAHLTAQDIADVVAGTLRDLGRLKFQQVAQTFQDYEVFSKWFKKDRVQFDSGIGIQRTLMNRVNSGAARHVGYLQNDATNIIDVLDQLTVDWRHAVTSWSIIYQTDILMNSGKEMVLNVIAPKRASSLIGLIEELEDKAFATPPSTSDKALPWGVKYWVVQNATTGFNGGAPSGHTTVGGVSLTDTPNFKNYTAQYAAVTKADLITKMRVAHSKCMFKSPLRENDYRNGATDRYRIYTDLATQLKFADVGESQNENLGRDIASMDGEIYFRRHPIRWIPRLDNETNAPVYMLDHSTFYPVVLKGDYLRESEARQNPNNHNVFDVFVDLTYNYLCLDRRRNAVFQTA